jgi:hypothetical protein
MSPFVEETQSFLQDRYFTLFDKNIHIRRLYMYYNEEKVDLFGSIFDYFFRERPIMKESIYQTELMKKIKAMIPGCLVLKNDPRYLQGFPDLIVLFQNMWAVLEVKNSPKAHIQTNQQHYINTLGAMSFASFINPNNEEEVLSELQHSFGIARKARVSKS